MKIGLVVHAERRQAQEVAARVVAAAARHGLQIVARPRDAERFEVAEEQLDRTRLDLLMAVGGDGTMLEAAGLGLETDTPVLGVNVGRMGFLAEVEPAAIEQAMEALAAGRWHEVRRSTVRVKQGSDDMVLGVNDVVIDRAASTRMVSLEVEIDGVPYTTYHADGVVVSTPTGSTAYSFSAGGPLVDPALEALILTAVAPHSVLSRSLVVPTTSKLLFRVADQRAASLAVDGRGVAELPPGTEVEVTGGERPVRFASLDGHPFPSLVAKKFGVENA